MSRSAHALDYPRRYLDALRLIGRGRSVGADAPFEQAYAFARSVGVTQQDEEIRWLHELVRELRPRRVLELGVDEGGTLFLWTRAAAADAHLIGVDTRPPGPLGQWAPFPLARRRFAHPRQRIDLLMGADSHDAATRTRVERLLGGEPLDFLFVDGDHSRDGVAADFRDYAPLVRPGGLVAFHDVSQRPAPSTEGVAAFWREFSAEHETEECVTGAEPGFGIGVYRVPS